MVSIEVYYSGKAVLNYKILENIKDYSEREIERKINRKIYSAPTIVSDVIAKESQELELEPGVTVQLIYNHDKIEIDVIEVFRPLEDEDK